MSGDSPATIKNIWKCPFCGKRTMNITVAYNESDGFIHYDDRAVKVLVLRIKCEESLEDSVDRMCPAMSECGCYHLHIYPSGSCHAYYY